MQVFLKDPKAIFSKETETLLHCPGKYVSSSKIPKINYLLIIFTHYFLLELALCNFDAAFPVAMSVLHNIFYCMSGALECKAL